MTYNQQFGGTSLLVKGFRLGRKGKVSHIVISDQLFESTSLCVKGFRLGRKGEEVSSVCGVIQDVGTRTVRSLTQGDFWSTVLTHKPACQGLQAWQEE